jgi:transposase
LENRLYPPPAITSKNKRPQPDWPTIHRELKRPGVTLQLIWEEHRAQHPAGYGYSRYVAPGFMWRNRVRAASCAMIGIIDAT